MSKYIFVTGGVVSGVGKGIMVASLGRLLKERGLNVFLQKFDPYLNVDPGTVNPFQHGEVFVTKDGLETDLDVGHFERFLGEDLDKRCNSTIGKIYSSVINKERAGDYRGDTIQVIPHVTSEIKALMKSAGEDHDVVIVEIGGTVGDIEEGAYLESVRQMERELKEGNYLHIHMTYCPYLECTDEIKTKPTQHSVQKLNESSLYPDLIVCRTSKDVAFLEHHKRKVSMFCNLKSSKDVIHLPDCKSIYEVPLVLNSQGFDRMVCEKLGLPIGKVDLTAWEDMVRTMKRDDLPVVDIAIVGKYTEAKDAYLSVEEALRHAGWKNKYNVRIKLISAEEIELQGVQSVLKDFHGVIVAGGFGARGIEGKIMTAEYCRVNKIPYLGLCLGMQIAVIEFARNVAGLRFANSTEFNPNTPDPVIYLIPEEKGITEKGASMRLGNYPCNLIDGSLVRRLYGMPVIEERHRHRFEFNKDYLDKFVQLGMKISGVNIEHDLVEIIEYDDHPFFVGSQFHPELRSRPFKPHPLFVGFLSGAIGNIKKPKINN